MEVGIAFDLRSDFDSRDPGPEDRLEEYDSESTVHGIAAAIENAGCRPRLLGGRRRFLDAVLAAPPGLVFNLAEGAGSRAREAHVPAVCEMLGIPYTHSDPVTLGLCLDKDLAKRVVASHGLRTPRAGVARSVSDLDGLDLRFPVIAKPVCEGSSMGVRKSSRVTDAAALRTLVGRLIEDYGGAALVEEFCAGPEFTVAVVGEGAEASVLGVMEIEPKKVPPAEFVYALEVKRDWEDEVAYHVPPPRPAAVVRKIEDLALGACRALGCRDLARVDIRLDGGGEPHFIEVNPLPGINPVTGDVVILARLAGVPYEALIADIVARARRRNGI